MKDVDTFSETINYGSTYELPNVIDVPYPYISINDLPEVCETFGVESLTDEVPHLMETFNGIEAEYAPEGSNHFYISATNLAQHLKTRAQSMAAHDNGLSTGIVYLDKYADTSEDQRGTFRLDISRDSKDRLVARVGVKEDYEEQIENLVEWAEVNGHEGLLLVDDVLAFGATLPKLIKSLQELLPNHQVEVLVGIATSGGEWQGLEKVEEELGIMPKFLTKVYPSPQPVNDSLGLAMPMVRDRTIFGGKLGSHTSGVSVTYPYFLPFSATQGSIIDRDRPFEASREYLNFNKLLVNHLEQSMEEEMTIDSLVTRDFGIPHTNIDQLQGQLVLPPAKTRIIEYIEQAEEVLTSYET